MVTHTPGGTAAAPALSAPEYQNLLSAALTDASTASTRRHPSARTLFTPESHRAALFPDTVVVQGSRGAGKTFWYRSLLDKELRDLAATDYRINRLRRLRVAPGYGETPRPEDYPTPQQLRALLEAGEDPYDIWYAVLLTALGQAELRGLPEWADKVRWVRDHPGPAERAVEQADRRAVEENLTHLVLFDALEHLPAELRHADRLVSGLLQLALHMRFGTQNIRLKVFLRPDSFEAAGRHFADASKLSAYSATLEWSQTELYGLLFHYLGNLDGAEARRFRELTGGWQPAGAGARQTPPRLLTGEPESQKLLFDEIADPFMGSNHRRGKTYTWLPNHLKDGRGQVSPRSFLEALSIAVQFTRARYPGHDRALHYQGVRAGQRAAAGV